MRKIPTSEARESSLSHGWTVEAAPVAEPVIPEPETALTEADAAERPEVSNVAVMLLGVFGGLFLLYTWAWFTIAQFYSLVNAASVQGSGSIGGIFQQIVFWVATVAPAAWFLTGIVLTRKKPTWQLAAVLVLGLIVLAPLPLLITPGGN